MIEPRLSTDDLQLFFEPRHHGLATHLQAIADRFGLADSHQGIDRARRAAFALASSALFPLLLPSRSDGDEARVDVRALCLVREFLGQVSPLADAIFAVQGLGTHPIVLAGTEAQRASLLPRAASGELIFGFALTEPEAGSDVASLRTSAERAGDGFVLRGEKTFISNAGIATHYLVFASTDPAAGKRGISAFVVEADHPGLSIAPIPLSIDHPIGSLRFDGCALPASALVGTLGGGLSIALRTLDTFRVTVGAAACGMARRALDLTIVRVATRHQFGKPLAEQQQVQAYLAEMATDLDAARLLVLRAAREKDRGAARLPAESAMAKLFATEAAQRIIDHAVQLHGALGVTQGSEVERLYREIRPLRIYEGTTEIQRVIIARELMARPRAL